jgi:ribosomal protein L7Ae-like RNA K-turn-binding protein
VQLLAELARAAERRVVGLLLAAHRGRKLAFGGQAVTDAVRKTQLALLASDARSAAKEPTVAELAAGGRLIVWGTKELYGDLLGRSDVAVVAICDAGIARATAFAISLTKISFDSGDGSQSPTNFPEVR